MALSSYSSPLNWSELPKINFYATTMESLSFHNDSEHPEVLSVEIAPAKANPSLSLSLWNDFRDILFKHKAFHFQNAICSVSSRPQ